MAQAAKAARAEAAKKQDTPGGQDDEHTSSAATAVDPDWFPAEGWATNGSADVEDGDTTANYRRPTGPFLRPDRPVAGPSRASVGSDAAARAAGPAGSLRSSRSPTSTPHTSGTNGFARPARSTDSEADSAGLDAAPSAPAREGGRPRWLSSAVLRVGDIPIRAVYGIGATIVTAIIVILIFVLFGGDKPGDAVQVNPAQGGGPAASSVKPTPTPTPIVVPPVPDAKVMTVFPGANSPILSYVVDRTTGISYSQYGAPWAKTTRAPFSFAQKAGPARQQALIGSAPVPVAVAKTPTTSAQFRTLAAKAAKWTLRYQPAGAKFTWTVSQAARYNLGWLVGYKVTYVQGGKKHTSQAYVMVISTAKKKPGMLFANIPDTHKTLYRDLNMLFWTARSI